MSRSRIVFLLIIFAALAIVGVGQVVQRLPVAPTATPLPALQVEIAVNPLAFDWVSQQAAAFNKQQLQVDGQPVQIRVTQRDGIEVWQAGGLWSAASHPTAWIPEGTFALNYAGEINLRYEVLTPSVANTPLIWGIFSDRADRVVAPVDWPSLQDATTKNSWSELGGDASWGFVKPAFALPQRSTAGFAVLLSAAASYAKSADLTPQNISDRNFQEWLRPVAEAVPNFTSLGQRPVTALASRGVSAADFALLPEADWLTNYSQISSKQPLKFFYPAYTLTFDMPFAVWSGTETTAAERNIARQFADFLGQADAQKQAATFGLRPALVKLSDANTSLFTAAADAGILLDLPSTNPINIPSSRNSILGLLSWFKSIRSS
jgi:hypothetical protein